MGRWIYARWAVSVSEVEAAMRRSRATVRWAGACAPKARTGGSIKSAENRHRVLEPREQAGGAGRVVYRAHRCREESWEGGGERGSAGCCRRFLTRGSGQDPDFVEETAFD